MRWDAMTCLLVQGGVSRDVAETISKLLDVNRVGGLVSDDVAAALIRSCNRQKLQVLQTVQNTVLRMMAGPQTAERLVPEPPPFDPDPEQTGNNC